VASIPATEVQADSAATLSQSMVAAAIEQALEAASQADSAVTLSQSMVAAAIEQALEHGTATVAVEAAFAPSTADVALGMQLAEMAVCDALHVCEGDAAALDVIHDVIHDVIEVPVQPADVHVADDVSQETALGQAVAAAAVAKGVAEHSGAVRSADEALGRLVVEKAISHALNSEAVLADAVAKAAVRQALGGMAAAA